MSFKAGDVVRIRSLGKLGRVTAIRGKRAKIQLENMGIECALSNLEASQETPPAKKTAPTVQLPQFSPQQRKSLQSLDLHGLTTNEAIAALDQHLNQAILAGLDRTDIVHGLGSGRVRDAVYARLSAIPAVRKFELDMFNPGVTHVFLG
ncbi:MAG: Smr/MutS family protein [Oligoflexia bacterium]|nr:Smr/MutS family protein [Oligoflexia bacterium]